MSRSITNNQREVIAGQSTITSTPEALKSTGGALNVSATLSIDNIGLATAANQTNGNEQVQGNMASGSIDSGNPVKAGGRYNATPPVAVDGQRGDLQLDSAFNLKTASLITNGTQAADTFAGDSGQNGLIVGPGRKEVSFTTTSVQPVATTDVSNYRWVSVQINSQGTTSTVTFQGSNDNANWVNVSLMISTAAGNTIPVVSTTAASSYVGPLHFRYFRLNVTAITAGTTAGVIEFMSLPSQQPPLYSASTQLALVDNADGVVVTATANGLKTMSALRLFNNVGYDRARSIIDANNTIGTGILATGLLAQFDDVAPTATTENQFGNLRMSANRNAYATLRDAAGNERGANINAANQLTVIDQTTPAATALTTYSVRITTNVTTTPIASLVYISSIVICVETAGTTSTIDIRDKSGTPIYLVRSLSTAAVLNNGDLVYNFQTPIKMTGGIDVITGGSVAATVGVFINYYA